MWPSKSKRRRNLKSNQRRRLLVEPLEDRRMLATFVVTNLSDGLVSMPGHLPGSLRQAIFDANAKVGHDTIEFSTVPGVITLTHGELDILDEVTINGPGALNLAINGNDTTQIFLIGTQAVDIDAEINNMSLINGNTPSVGGAILAFGGLTVRECLIAGNTSIIGGGGIHVITPVGRSTLIENCTITGNDSSAGWGGGVYSENNSGTVTISGSNITGNFATVGGGGIYAANSHGTTTITGSSITANSTELLDGGGIDLSNSSGTTSINASVITGNSAENGDGGGIHSFNFSGGTTEITGSTITGNVASDRGGGIRSRNSEGITEVSGSTISGNSASDGGGLYVSNTADTTKITDSTISGNASDDDGGGVFSTVDGGTIEIKSSTIVNNSADEDGDGTGLGGGIYVGTTASVRTDIRHTIVAENLSDSTPNDLDGNLGTLEFFSAFGLIGVEPPGGVTGVSNQFGTVAVPLDPLLGPLQNNGGSTETRALLPGSPAINSGNPFIPSPSTFDQRGDGFDRIVGPAIDIGAFELGNKFYVVDNKDDETIRYEEDGTDLGSTVLDGANQKPTGIAAHPNDGRTWVVDSKKDVYQYDAAGNIISTWEVDDVKKPEGIATDGFNIWIADRTEDEVFFYAGGANFADGTVNTETATFPLDASNKDAYGITWGKIAGVDYLWVVNDKGSTESVFRYQWDSAALTGTLDQTWEFDATNSNSKPRGITVNPNNVDHVWIVDDKDDEFHRFDNAADTALATEVLDATFPLAAGNNDPQGIADPSPPPASTPQDRHDVNSDGTVSANDVLVIANYLNGLGSDQTAPRHLDVNGDGFISPIDVALVINQLNTTPATAEAESTDQSKQIVVAPTQSNRQQIAEWDCPLGKGTVATTQRLSPMETISEHGTGPVFQLKSTVVERKLDPTTLDEVLREWDTFEEMSDHLSISRRSHARA